MTYRKKRTRLTAGSLFHMFYNYYNGRDNKKDELMQIARGKTDLGPFIREDKRQIGKPREVRLLDS